MQKAIQSVIVRRSAPIRHTHFMHVQIYIQMCATKVKMTDLSLQQSSLSAISHQSKENIVDIIETL